MESINLKQLINDYPECITNGAKLKAILLDTYPEISKAIVNTLVIMANSGIAKEIQDSENITELDKSRWQQKLEDEGFAEKIIFSCLNMVFAAFGLNGEKLTVETAESVSVQPENVLPPTNLADFEIKNGVLVKYKGDSADVVIPDGIQIIEKYAFNRCRKLKKITIPNSVIEVRDSAFFDCSGLIGVYIFSMQSWCHIKFGNHPANPLNYARKLFLNGDLVQNLNIPYGIKEINDYAFTNCSSITNVVFPNGMKKIGWQAFYSCSNLTYLTVPDSIVSVDNAFDKCDKIKFTEYRNAYYLGNKSNPHLILLQAKNVNISSCVVHEDTKVIATSAFCNCTQLQSMLIPQNIAEISDAIFAGCTNLSNISIPDSISKIGQEAFSECRKLKRIIIPKTVDYIGEDAFLDCENLYEIIYMGTREMWNRIASNADFIFGIFDGIKTISCSDGTIRLDGDKLYNELYGDKEKTRCENDNDCDDDYEYIEDHDTNYNRHYEGQDDYWNYDEYWDSTDDD